jgi:hypothetical protein
MCSEEPIEVQENRNILSDFVMVSSVFSSGSALPQYIVEFVAIICTGLKSVFSADSAVETRIMRWKVSPVHWKVGLHIFTTIYRIDCSL